MKFYDTSIMLSLLQSPYRSLKSAAEILLGVKTISYEAAKAEGPEAFRKYALRDPQLTLKIFNKLMPVIHAWGLTLLNQIEMSFAIVSLECERNGIRVDIKKLQEIGKKITQRMAEVEKDLNEGLQKPVNWRSPKQVISALVFNCNAPLVIDKGKASTSTPSLKKIRQAHPKVNLLLELKALEATNRLIKKMLKFVVPKTERLHPYYDTLGADTGRATSKNPNMQNVPRGSDIRTALIASYGYKLLRLDFGQIEPRTLAHFLPNTNFAALFTTKYDYYEKIGELLFYNLPIQKSGRDAAKVFQLSMLYGAGDKSLSERLGVDQKVGMLIMRRFDEQFPEVNEYRQSIINQTRETGFAIGLLNRRRYLPDINSDDSKTRYKAERQAFNAVIQGSAATLFKFKTVELRRALPLDAKFLLHIHDELVLEVPTIKAQEYFATAIKTLEAPVPWFTTPIKVDGGIGDNWLEAKSKGGL